MAKEIDQLTTLLKEDWLKQGLDDELNRAERFGRDLGLLLIEPDIPADLKRDLMYPVLKKLGTLAKDVLRVVDVGVRIKDKVFFLLPETSVEGVEVATNKLAEKFYQQTFVDAATGTSYQGRFRSASLVFPGQTKDRENLLERLTAELKVVPSAVSVEAAPEAGEEGQGE